MKGGHTVFLKFRIALTATLLEYVKQNQQGKQSKMHIRSGQGKPIT